MDIVLGTTLNSGVCGTGWIISFLLLILSYFFLLLDAICVDLIVDVHYSLTDSEHIQHLSHLDEKMRRKSGSNLFIGVNAVLKGEALATYTGTGE